jgi:Na+-driven multidrug efflux pump
MPESVTLRAAYRFFVPLIFMTELNMISKSVINAALARTPDQNVTLAAFHIAFTLYFALASSTEVCAMLALSYLRTRRALRHLLRFMVMIVTPSWVVGQCLAFTPLGDLAFGGLFGVSDRVIAEAKLSTFLLSLSAPFLIGRAICFGLILIHKRTIFITVATFVRLASLGGSLVLLPLVFEGAAVGAAAMSLCMAAEALTAFVFARRFFRRLPEGDEPDAEVPPTPGQQWRFSWPLMLNQSAEMGVVTAISIFLGRLADPDLALAAYNVVYGLVSLLMSPVRNLVQTAQTLVQTVADRRPLVIFALQLIAGFGAIALLLFHTPLEDPVLAGAMGLKPALQDYAAPALKLAFLMSAAWAFSALFRGLLAGARSTTMMAVSGVSRIAVAALLSSSVLVFAGLNGAVVGLVAWMAGYACEAALLGYALKRLDTRPRPGSRPGGR